MKPIQAAKHRAIDWQQARARLAKAAAALNDPDRLAPERARAILDKERYAIETRHVREVLRVRGCTPLPGTPEFLVGITNLRGQILAVLDLRTFFGIASQQASELSRVIVLGHERVEFGVLADVVFEVIVLRIDELCDPPGSVGSIAREYLRGVTGDALILLDGAILLQDPRLFIDLAEDGALAAGGEKT